MKKFGLKVPVGHPIELPSSGNKKISEVSLELATAECASDIASWIVDDQELRWLGGGAVSTREAEILKWINEAIIAFRILAQDQACGFITVQRGAFGIVGSGFEIGRLLIAPKFRRKGIGSAVTGHVDRHLHQMLDMFQNGSLEADTLHCYFDGVCHEEMLVQCSSAGAEVLMRSFRDNQAALRLLRKLPLRTLKDSSKKPDNSHLWFTSKLRSVQRGPASAIEARRNNAKMSMVRLAALSGIKQSTISNLEKGIRRPSWENYRSLMGILSVSEVDYVKMALEFFEEDLPEHIVQAGSVFESLADDKKDKWIISDILAETQDYEVFKRSVEAIRKGYKRYYFTPHDKDYSDIRNLMGNFRSELGSGISAMPIRFYRAPEYLCHLRLVFENVDTVGMSVENATAAGPNRTRVSLDHEAAKNIVRKLRGEMEFLKRDPSRREGFSIYPLDFDTI